MSEEEHGGGGWHDNLQQAGDLVAMATNEDVCIRGESQRSAAEGTHAARLLAVMEDRRGPEGGTPFPSTLAVPTQSLFHRGGSCPTGG